MNEHRKEYLKKYQREWAAKRRAIFFNGQSCAKCNSTLDLELDHIDPDLKISHAIWSWKKSRREVEISKCQVLCHDCHQQKSAAYCRTLMLGKPNRYCRKLTDEQANSIRCKLADGKTERSIAKEFNVSKTTVHSVKTAESYAITINGDRVVGAAALESANS